MWGYLRLRWGLSETSKNTTPPRAPNGTKKGRCRTKKRPIQKKGHYRTSPLKNGLTKLPCFLKILASWGDFFDNGLMIYPFSDHTMQCCTQKPMWCDIDNNDQRWERQVEVYLLMKILACCGAKSRYERVPVHRLWDWWWWLCWSWWWWWMRTFPWYWLCQPGCDPQDGKTTTPW